MARLVQSPCWLIPIPDRNGNLDAITLHVTDRAGNVASTNLAVTLDYAGATNPPVTELLWPTNGVTIAGDTMTLRGQIDGATAHVSVRWVDTGETNTLPVIVERNGKFWIENLPLQPGTNEFSLVAQNAAGYPSETGFTLIRGSLNLTVTYTTEVSNSTTPLAAQAARWTNTATAMLRT